MEGALTLLLAGVVGSDLLMVYLIGVCPAIAVTRKLETAAGLAFSNMVVAPLAAVLSYILLGFVPGTGSGMMIELPIIVVSILVCLFFVASVGERVWQRGHDWLEPFAPLMTINCTLLGVVLVSLIEARGIVHVYFSSLGLALGYGLFLIVFSQVRERLTATAVPQAFRDAPIAILSIGILGMALAGVGGTY